MKKVTISMNDELLERIDDYAKKNCTTRSGFLSLVSLKFLNDTELASVLRDMTSVIGKIVDSGQGEPEELAKLEAYRTSLLAMYSPLK